MPYICFGNGYSNQIVLLSTQDLKDYFTPERLLIKRLKDYSDVAL